MPEPRSGEPGLPTPRTAAEFVRGIVEGDRSTLGRAITLVESSRPDHGHLAQDILSSLPPSGDTSLRVGITGVPGVGKSSFIESLGCALCERGHKVAVLAVDPSSAVSGGSILGDKTRMEKLSRHPRAFIRPSPSSCHPGGVARKSRETLLLCEAAGYDLILVETVGVGQGEVEVHSMVDCFVLLVLAGAGDELQGIKKGIMELADLVVITKADGDNLLRAQSARNEMERVLHILSHDLPNWSVPALLASVQRGETLDAVWSQVGDFIQSGRDSGYFTDRRRRQILDWVHFLVREELRTSFERDAHVRAERPKVEKELLEGTVSHLRAVRRLLEGFRYPPA
ncbi:MAG: methylmalonyl Co-A mutase-associated GTPase MeaB [Blastochloris sp.]|nr:methylmalonyl Co-A mutase-associated GTPase MeaB [Blastochloris sp.]